MTVQAIETTYAGCRFRSRLEARWAVFFDHLGIPWEYEPQGFEIPHWGDPSPPQDDYEGVTVGRYLPDFWLPDQATFVEVKGSDTQASADYREMLSWGIDWHGPLAPGLLLLGPIPDVSKMVTSVCHAHLTWDKGVRYERVEFRQGYASEKWVLRKSGLDHYMSGSFACAPEWPTGASWDAEVRKVTDDRGNYWPMPYRSQDAYFAARSARFEHGEAPSPSPVHAAREALARARQTTP